MRNIRANTCPCTSTDSSQDKLQDDLASFADDYHQRVLKGLAPVAESYDEEEEEGEEGAAGGHRGESGGMAVDGVEAPQQQATILPDGVIDVTPAKPKPVHTSCSSISCVSFLFPCVSPFCAFFMSMVSRKYCV